MAAKSSEMSSSPKLRPWFRFKANGLLRASCSQAKHQRPFSEMLHSGQPCGNRSHCDPTVQRSASAVEGTACAAEAAHGASGCARQNLKAANLSSSVKAPRAYKLNCAAYALAGLKSSGRKYIVLGNVHHRRLERHLRCDVDHIVDL